MRIVTNTSVLTTFINKVQAACAKKNAALPILQHILFCKIDDDYYLVGSSSDQWMQVRIDFGSVEGDWFNFLLPFGAITSALALLPDQPCTLDIEDLDKEKTGHALKVTTMQGNGKETVLNSVVLTADEYPEWAKAAVTTTITLPVKQLLTYTKEASKYSAQDELRPVMNGVYLDIYPEKVIYVATNTHVLYRNIIPQKEPIIKEGEHFGVNIPKDAVAMLASALYGEEEVTISFDDRTVSFSTQNVLFKSVLLAGRYPNYNSVIPANNGKVAKVLVRDFVRSISLVRNFTSQATDLISLRFGLMDVEVSACDYDFGQEGKDFVTLEENKGVPDKFAIGLKGSSILTCLKDICTDNVIMEMSAPSTAVLLHEDSEGSDLTLLLMPMLLNN